MTCIRFVGSQPQQQIPPRKKEVDLESSLGVCIVCRFQVCNYTSKMHAYAHQFLLCLVLCMLSTFVHSSEVQSIHISNTVNTSSVVYTQLKAAQAKINAEEDAHCFDRSNSQKHYINRDYDRLGLEGKYTQYLCICNRSVTVIYAL